MQKSTALPTLAKRNPLARWVARASLVVALVTFVGTFSLLALDYDANERFSDLETRGLLVPLPKWEARDAKCQSASFHGPQCLELGLGRVETLPMPAPDGATADHVVLRPELGPAARAWLAARPWAVLWAPRQAHNETWMSAGTTSARAVGMGNDVTLYFPTAKDADDPQIQMIIDRTALAWYGPADISPALIDPAALADAQSLTTRLAFASDLQSQLEIGFPLLVAGVSLVLDHSPVFALASAYGTLRALRGAFVVHLLHGKLGFEGAWPFVYAGLNAACAVALCALAHVLSGGRVRTRVLAPFAVAVATVFLVAQARHPDFELVADMWADGFGSALGLVACTWNFLGRARAVYASRPGRTQTSANSSSATSRREEHKNRVAPLSAQETSHAVAAVVALLLFGGLGLHAAVNISELLGAGEGTSRNPLDWRHAMLFPALLTASLVKVGSLARGLVLYARRITHDALVSAEVELAREVHGRTLPPRHGHTGTHAWRIFHAPCSSLGGDWVDARSLVLHDGTPVLAACVVDATGHGLGASLVTGIICSQWRLWCRRLQGMEAETFAGQKETLLSEAAATIHAALVAVEREDNCTAVFLLHNSRTGEVTYLTCGHPGVLMRRARGPVEYLRTHATGLGVSFAPRPTAATWRASSTTSAPGDTFALYSDGLVPPGKAITSWLKRIQRLALSPSFAFPGFLAAQVRENRTSYRLEPDLEDDITLLLVSYEQRSVESHTEPEEASCRTG
ncbi:MAG: serine/threonine-protein phosphatase [Silvanigrellales bacterium]|nr:serine/threonine-protein phosphatase [Silvanigrellales bacterium]